MSAQFARGGYSDACNTRLCNNQLVAEFSTTALEVNRNEFATLEKKEVSLRKIPKKSCSTI